MTFNDLPKQQRLLIYMFYYEAESGSAITMSKNGGDIIAYGISKNKNSLANMLYTLRKKGFVNEAILRNGEVAYQLTTAGQDSARHFINLCGNDIEVPEVKDSLQETEAVDVDWHGIAKQFADAAAKLTNSLKNPTSGNSLYKQVEQLKAENVAKDEKISVLSHSLRDALHQLDEKTKQAQHLENALSKIENSLGQMAVWAHNLKNGSN